MEHRSGSSYSGGLFQFIPFAGTAWVPKLLLSVLKTTRIQFMLFLCALSIALLGVLLIYYVTVQLIRPRVQSRSSLPKTLSDQVSDHLFFDEDPDSSFGFKSRASSSMEMNQFTAQWDFEAALDNLVSENHVQHHLKRETRTSGTKFVCQLSAPRTMAVQPYIRRSRRITALTGTRRRIVILSIIAAVFAICLIAHLTSLVIAIRTDYLLSEALDDLPGRGHWIMVKALEFIEFALDSAYDRTCVHIQNDAARSDGDSHLRALVERAKVLGSEAVACLIETSPELSTNWTSKAVLLFPPANIETSKIERLAKSLLGTFELVLSRLNALFEAASALNVQTIRRTERAWYEYYQGLSRLVPIQNKWIQHSSSNDSWRSSELLSEAYHVICDNLFHIRAFSSCEQVGTYLHSFVTYGNALPAMLPVNNLESVIQFVSIPRALHAEQLVENWLPVVTDLPGRGVLFLLQTYLVPDLTRLKSHLSNLAADASSAGMIDHFVRYTRYFNSVMTIIFTVLFLCGVVLLIVTFYGIFRVCLNSRDWSTNQESDSISITSSIKTDIFKTVQTKSCHPHRCQRLRWWVWLFVTLVCLLLLLLSTGLVWASVLIENDGCVYLFRGPAQHIADLQLADGLHRILYQNQMLEPILNIPNLHVSIPYPILQTLDSGYWPGQIALFPSLHWNQPVNLTALLHSLWFNQTLHQLWDKDVRERLKEIDLSVKIPKIHLIQVFNQVVNSMQLERSFDQLAVKSLDQYLNSPGPAYAMDLYKILTEIDTLQSHRLASAFANVSRSYDTYSQGYQIAAKNLVKIERHKELITPLRMLMANASIALDRLNQMNNQDLTSLIDQVIISGWPKFLPCVGEQLIPFLLNLLDDLIPYPGLQSIYHESIRLVCSSPTNLSPSELTPNATLHTSLPLNPELDTLGSSVFVSAFTLLLAGLVSLFIH